VKHSSSGFLWLGLPHFSTCCKSKLLTSEIFSSHESLTEEYPDEHADTNEGIADNSFVAKSAANYLHQIDDEIGNIHGKLFCLNIALSIE
jgi:hypothetical protein